MNLDWVPRHRRGVSSDVPGLGFMGLPFQYGLASALIGGVTRDAAYLADNLSGTRRPLDGRRLL